MRKGESIFDKREGRRGRVRDVKEGGKKSRWKMRRNEKTKISSGEVTMVMVKWMVKGRAEFLRVRRRTTWMAPIRRAARIVDSSLHSLY